MVVQPERLGERIRTLRYRRGLTQAQLAYKAGVGEKTLKRVEAGQTDMPRPETLAALAGALGVTPEALFEPAEGSAEAKAGTPAIHQLPRPPRNFVGRGAELQAVEARLAEGPLVDRFFAWCDEQAPLVLDETPIARAIGYARNQRDGLRRFLNDGRLPLHNNKNKNTLRRQAVGRGNWTFLGNDEGGEVNAIFVSLLASCRLHDIEPWAYLRDLLCLLPSWPIHRVLELAAVNWRKTLEQEETQRRLAENVFRRIALA